MAGTTFHNNSTCKWLLLIVSIILLFSLQSQGANINLHNHHWQIIVDPTTLAIQAQPLGHPKVVVSEGVGPHKVSQALQIKDTWADWQWDYGKWQLQIKLQNHDLLLTIQAKQPGPLQILQQPSTANCKGLILPLAEGHYIPRKHKIWEDFLLHLPWELDTTEGLSLPLWGMDYGQYSLHWILTNPFNNQLLFQPDPLGLSLSLSHEFIALDPTKPFTAILHLSDDNPLAGATRYRRWLIERGLFEPLSQKLQKQPQGIKLLGASHIYLWGNDALAVADVRDWSALIAYLKAETTFSQTIRQHLDYEALATLNTTQPLETRQKTQFIQSLNQALNDLARIEWQHPVIDLELLGSSYQTLHEQLVLNFGSALGPDPNRWGNGLSVKTIEVLQAAGLTHLWLGVADGWEGGLWHPAAIARAVQAGYIVGPYDSYQTAVQPCHRSDWATAHLGEEIYRNCGIIKLNGSLTPGFSGEGYYTNPSCVRPFLNKRITRIQQVCGFNSWFLDSYATGMVFDDFRYEASMTQAKMADENVRSMNWTGDHLNLVVGSEAGNAVTARGLMFAHGMQTPVIGTEDSDMQENPESPYYLGKWYPKGQPTLFFKPVPLKKIYKTVNFDVRYRLPLYQTVFHDSVITTHHWTLDNFKLGTVYRENNLVQLLYNVPPLYHLNQATLKERLPLILRQDIFFKPLHQRLVRHALVGFRWLSEDGNIQQTEFADSTRLIANFGPKLKHHKGVLLPAYSVTALPADGPITRFIMPRSTLWSNVI